MKKIISIFLGLFTMLALVLALPISHTSEVKENKIHYAQRNLIKKNLYVNNDVSWEFVSDSIYQEFSSNGVNGYRIEFRLGIYIENDVKQINFYSIDVLYVPQIGSNNFEQCIFEYEATSSAFSNIEGGVSLQDVVIEWEDYETSIDSNIFIGSGPQLILYLSSPYIEAVPTSGTFNSTVVEAINNFIENYEDYPYQPPLIQDSIFEIVLGTIQNYSSTLVTMLGSVVGLFYSAENGLTILGVLLIFSFGIGIVKFGFNFIKSLMRI